MHAHLAPAQLELQDRRAALDALDHAGRQGGQQQIGGVERIHAAGQACIQRQFGILAAGDAAVDVGSTCVDPEGQLAGGFGDGILCGYLTEGPG
jgi:hypothetical protein